MESMVLVVREINVSPEEKVNKDIKALGKGWRVIHAETAISVFGVVSNPLSSVPIHHCLYVTTVVMQKD